MAEENLENQEQEQKTQYSIEQIEALIAKVNDLEVEVASLNKALHKKQMRKAKEEMRAQAKADAIVACAKYKVNKEDADKVVEEITARYEAEYEKIKTEYEEKGEEIRSQHEKNEDEYDELLIKESKAELNCCSSLIPTNIPFISVLCIASGEDNFNTTGEGNIFLQNSNA